MELGLKLVNLGLVAAFIGLIIVFLLAALRGFLRGVWKSTHNFIFMLALIVIAFATLNAFVDYVGNFPLGNFIKGSFYASRVVDGETLTYYVPITSVKETFTEYVKGIYLLYNVSVSEASAANFAVAFVNSILKVGLVLVDMLLIVTLGNLFCFLSWILVFKNLVPKIARRRIKMRWVGLAETAVTFLMVTFMFMTPFTAVVNSVNQAYQRNEVAEKSDNEMLVNVGNFVNAYDNSIFAKVLFNWTVDKNGMTYDARLFDALTAGVSGDYTINVVREIVNIINLAANGASAITTKDGETVIDIGSLITKEITGKAFDAVINSAMIQYALPIIVEVALNSDLLNEYVPGRLIDLSDVKWEEEIGYVRDMTDVIFDSGVVDNLMVVGEDGKHEMRKFEGNDLATFIEEIVYSENFIDLLDIFKSIDDSKVLTRAIPALLQYLINSDEEGKIKQFLPLTWEELNEFSWGYETYVLFDFLHSVALLDDNFLRTIFVKTGLYTTENPDQYDLAALISAHADEFKELVVGKFDSHDNLINVDSHGHTKVFDNEGKRIQGANYCLFDMNLVAKIMPSLLDGLFDLEAFNDIKSKLNEEDLDMFHQAVASLNNGERLVNYKKEFNNVLDVVATLANDTDLLDALVNGKGFESLMQEEGNVFSIDISHVNYLKQAVAKMDKSAILYRALAPMLKGVLSGEDITNSLNDIGLKTSVLVSAIDHDMKSDTHNLFNDVSSLLDAWGDLDHVQSLSSETGDTNALMEKLKDDEIIASFKNVLLLLVNNPLINPTPTVDDDYEKYENLFGLIEFVFSNTADLGLTVTRDTLRKVESSGHTWEDEIDAVANVLQFIAIHDLMNASSAFDNGLNHEAIAKLVGHSNDDYYIKGLFEAVGDSYIFKSTLGPFLDDLFGESLDGFLIDKENHITFSNIVNWSEEGQNIENLLKSLDHLVPDGDATDFFNNLNLTKFQDIVDLNAMLHDLANSGIFTYIDEENTAHYQFGKWLYNLIDSSMGSFTVDSNEYDLLSDPKFANDSIVSWDTANWGVRPEDGANPDKYYLEWKNEYNPDGAKSDTHYIVYKDFVYVNGMDNTDTRLPSFWCDYDSFVNAQKAFLGGEYGDEFVVPSSYLDNDWEAYYGSDQFINDYNSVFEIDEISRVMKFTCYAMRLLQPRPRVGDTQIAFNEIPKDLLNGLLLSLNETHCMRVGIYNFYSMAADNYFSMYQSNGFSLTNAYETYIIDVDLPMFDFEHARSVRAEELERLVNFYDLINVAISDGVISGNTFIFENMRNNNFLEVLENTLKDVNDSYIFHRKGSSKVDGLTVFQGLFNHLLGDSEIGNSIYLGNKSPKDVYYASEYSSASEKVRYLVTNVFPDDEHNSEPNLLNQKSEIHKLIQTIDAIYSLKNSSDEITASITEADLSNDENVDTIHNVLTILNSSDLLGDLVPNSLYKLLVEGDQFSVSYNAESVDFSKVDPFYHYYYNVNTLSELATPNFKSARYSQNDIDGIRDLIEEYQAFNDIVDQGSIVDCDILKLLTGTVDTSNNFHSTGTLSSLLKILHNNPIFHTPARNYSGTYYTNEYQGSGYTLFEEMMSKVISFVGLDDFAYDNAYDSEASAAIKLNNRIKAVTSADDGLGSGVYYHVTPNQAWNQEIDSIMEIAYRAADMSSGSTIDVSNLALNELEPDDVRDILTAVNHSDIIADAIPKFVKDGFTNINIGTLTSYDAADYANYRIGQDGYEVEIDNIYDILDALTDGSNYITNFDDISTFVDQDTTGERLKGLICYIYESRILNTPTNGEYNDYYLVSGKNISAQGVVLYNVFDNSGLSGFIARDAIIETSESSTLDKISQLSYIVHMPKDDSDAINAYLTYETESRGLSRLIGVTNEYHIDASTFTGTGNDDINTVMGYKTPLLSIVNIAYDADEIGHRSALVSEFVSGLLNNVLENEYTKLNDKTGYTYNAFTFGKPVSETNIKFIHYNAINEIEKNGLNGILNAVDLASNLNIPTLLTMSEEDRHALANDLESAFALMTTNNINSEVARIVYLNDFHPVIKPIAPTNNKNSENFSSYLVNEGSTSTSAGTNTVYSEDFFFSNYGTALKNYIYPGFY